MSFIVAGLTAAIIGVGCTATPIHETPRDHPAVSATAVTEFYDNFNGPAGSGPPGNLLYSTGAGWARGELQSYSTSRANVYEDGHGDLVLKAIKDSHGRWTSGRLTTRDSFYQGTISARILFPDQSGMWPAFWSENKVNEIDIMELYGNHTWNAGSALHNPTYQIHEGFGLASSPVGWHTWTEKWNSATIRFYEDGHLYYTARTPAVFNNGVGMQLILNLAVGGAGGGPVPSSTKTMVMLIKWLIVTKG